MPWSKLKAWPWKDRLELYCLTVVLCPVLIILLPWERLTRKERSRQDAERRAWRRRQNPRPRPEPPLRPLPLVRERRLTDGESHHPQLQSALIARVPVEVRLLIWEHVLGRETDEDVLHLDLLDGSLGHVRCYESQPCCKRGDAHKCWGAISSAGRRVQPEGRDTKRKLLSTLLTCRLIYRETVDILYQSNTFDMRSSSSIYRLPRVMLPHRFQQIRRIRLGSFFKYSNYFPGTAQDRFAKRTCDSLNGSRIWPAACLVLASMMNLEDVEISVGFYRMSSIPDLLPPDELVIYTLGPLGLVRARRYSVIVKESLIDHIQRVLGSQPFQLVPYVQPGPLVG